MSTEATLASSGIRQAVAFKKAQVERRTPVVRRRNGPSDLKSPPPHVGGYNPHLDHSDSLSGLRTHGSSGVPQFDSDLGNISLPLPRHSGRFVTIIRHPRQCFPKEDSGTKSSAGNFFRPCGRRAGWGEKSVCSPKPAPAEGSEQKPKRPALTMKIHFPPTMACRSRRFYQATFNSTVIKMGIFLSVLCLFFSGLLALANGTVDTSIQLHPNLPLWA